MHKTKLGEFIHNRRIGLGLTLEEMANKSGIGTFQFLNSIERGTKTLPAKHIKSMAKALGITKNNLIEIMLMDLESDLKRKASAA